MYEEQCESCIRSLDSGLTVTAAWPALHGQPLLERATKHATGNRANCSLPLILFFLAVGVLAYGVSAFGIVVKLIWPHTNIVSQPSMRQLACRSISVVFSIKWIVGGHYYGTLLPKSSQDILCGAAFKRPAAYS